MHLVTPTPTPRPLLDEEERAFRQDVVDLTVHEFIAKGRELKPAWKKLLQDYLAGLIADEVELKRRLMLPYRH